MAHKKHKGNDLSRVIRKLVDEALKTGEIEKLGKSIRKAVNEVADAGNTVLQDVSEKITGVHTANQQKQLYGATAGKSVKSFFKTFFGVPLALFMGIATLGSIGVESVGMTMAMLLLCGGGTWLSVSGFSTFARIKRFRIYKRIIGQGSYASLEELSHSVGKSQPFVLRDVRKMILEGYFRQGHLDKEEKHLIVSDETYRYFEKSRLEMAERRRLEQEQKEQERQEAARQAQQYAAPSGPDAQVQEILNRGNAYIVQIRACNDAIPGEEISAKIARMENIVRQILQRAERDPKIVPDLKKMMDYYLPMTVKLLDAYADMDAQHHQGENIQTSKREIEGSLDTLNQAYEKLLDDLFEDTALDVSSDISVLNTLLAQEGLTGDGFDMKN